MTNEQYKEVNDALVDFIIRVSKGETTSEKRSGSSSGSRFSTCQTEWERLTYISCCSLFILHFFGFCSNLH